MLTVRSRLFVWFLLMVVAIAGAEELLWLGAKPRKSSTGLSIHGLKPGIIEAQLHSQLSGKCVVAVVDSNSKQKTLNLREAGLLVYLKATGKTFSVVGITCRPITEQSSVELDGEPVYAYGDSVDALLGKLKPEKVDRTNPSLVRAYKGKCCLFIAVNLAKKQIDYVSLK